MHNLYKLFILTGHAMTEFKFSEIKDLLLQKQYQKAVLNAHDFVQLALYQAIMSALWFLGDPDGPHKYNEKYMGVSSNSTLKGSEINKASKLRLISEVEKKFIEDLKKIRDSEAAHLSIYFDKETDEDDNKKDRVKKYVYESEKIINKLLNITNKIGVAHMRGSIDLMDRKDIKLGDIIRLGHSEEELFKIIDE